MSPHPPLRPPPPPSGGHEPHLRPMRGSWHPDKLTVSKLISLWKPLVALAVGVATTWGYLEAKLDQRIEQAVRHHDAALSTDPKPPHAEVQKRLQALETLLTAHAEQLNGVGSRAEVSEEALRELYWWLVGDKATQYERDPRKRAKAAREARERFLRYLREGESLDQAYRHALPSSVPGW